tara:strand:- start:790 stop:1296 length:507 start_codon:yes stop_codon:yes gene_type:complete
MVLGLDISTSVIGYALFKEDGKLHKMGHVELTKFKDLNSKAEQFKRHILAVVGSNISALETIIEAPLLTFSKFSNANTLAKLQAFNGIITYVMFTLSGKNPEHIAAARARKLVCGKLDRKNIKESVFTFVRACEPSIEWPTTRTGNYRKQCMDMADAYVVGRSYFKRS